MLLGSAVAVTVIVALPVGARVTLVLIDPLPAASAQVDGLAALQVHDGKVRSAVSLSTTGKPATASVLLLLVMTIVYVVLVPATMVEMASAFATETSALPELVSDAELLFTLLAPCVEVRLFAGMILVRVPTALVVTSTESSQVAPELIDPPVMPKLPVPGVALIVPVQVPLVAVKVAFAGDCTTSPAGMKSVSDTPESARPMVEGLLIKIVIRDVPPGISEVGLKLLLTETPSTTLIVRVATAVLPTLPITLFAVTLPTGIVLV